VPPHPEKLKKLQELLLLLHQKVLGFHTLVLACWWPWDFMLGTDLVTTQPLLSFNIYVLMYKSVLWTVLPKFLFLKRNTMQATAAIAEFSSMFPELSPSAVQNTYQKYVLPFFLVDSPSTQVSWRLRAYSRSSLCPEQRGRREEESTSRSLETTKGGFRKTATSCTTGSTKSTPHSTPTTWSTSS
jgi:hypothetical protein